VKIASWNVNSLTVRQAHVVEWMKSAKPDILALQEIKQAPDAFPADAFRALGYETLANGQKTYNGVATISRRPLTEPVIEIPDLGDPQRRVLAATIDGLRVVNLYVPNGQSLESEKYQYKLGWLAALRDFLAAELALHEHVVVLGDFNIAPEDRDVYDPKDWGEGVLCSGPEREALRALMHLGLVDVFRQFEQDEKVFSWWDYRAGRFRRNAGLRIDLILASPALAKRCTASYVDRAPRGWDRPSDHTPVIAEFSLW
jgi:exodeoxyribonuclease-3